MVVNLIRTVECMDRGTLLDEEFNEDRLKLQR